jgi:hypothetical protein
VHATCDVIQCEAGGLEYGAEGQPLANSHYGYHMVMWHIPFALSGQHWDAPSASLSFKPKLPAPFSLPVFVPGSVAVLEADGTGGGGSLKLVAGRPLTLKALTVGEKSGKASLPKTLAIGDAVEW